MKRAMMIASSLALMATSSCTQSEVPSVGKESGANLVEPQEFSKGTPAFDVEGGFEAFENLFGVTPGKRRNHTKGFCVEGTLSPLSSDITSYSISPIFTGQSQVIARVSHKGGKANPADDKFGLLGMAMEITAPDGDLHIIGMNTEHFFPVSTSEEFIELLRAKASGPEATSEFAASHPKLKAYQDYHSGLDKTLRPYEGTTYNSVNAFYLVDGEGERTPIRFSFIPSGGQDIVVETHPDFFLENMQENIGNPGVSWDMEITIANPGDSVTDPSVQWTGEHNRIVAARFTALRAMPENEGQCDSLNFDPTILSAGFAPSEDPMLQVRSMIYSFGTAKRLSEKD